MSEMFYKGSVFTTLADLELRCEEDEANLEEELTNLELGKQSGNDGTIGTFGESDEPNLGELIFESYKNEAEANLLESQHEMNGAKTMFRGKAQIGAKRVKVTVLRG